eukprot:SAG31_NODE_13634_length_856_cov_1.013210_1_plen_73_part_00
MAHPVPRYMFVCIRYIQLYQLYYSPKQVWGATEGGGESRVNVVVCVFVCVNVVVWGGAGGARWSFLEEFWTF